MASPVPVLCLSLYCMQVTQEEEVGVEVGVEVVGEEGEGVNFASKLEV